MTQKQVFSKPKPFDPMFNNNNITNQGTFPAEKAKTYAAALKAAGLNAWTADAPTPASNPPSVSSQQ